MSKYIQGLVIRSQAGYLTVETAQGVYLCRVRGKLRQGRAKGDLVAVGDQVMLDPQEDGTGSIVEVLPRTSVFSRQLSGVNYDYEQVILANPDQAMLVFACADPTPSLRMLDRFLVITERAHIPALVIANKIDLVGLPKAKEIFGLYKDIGYEVIYASAKTGEGVSELRSHLAGKLTSLAGSSGVGKSSLINAVFPNLHLETGELSQGTQGKGKHTTQVRQLYPVEGGGYIADVPGLRSLALWDIQPEELDAYFIEIAPLVSGCQFSDCTHSHEPGCAVRRAVELGKIDPARYDSYLRLRFGQTQEDLFEEQELN